VIADGILQGGPAGGEFAFDFRCAFECKKWMSEGVIADDVAGSNDFAGEIGTLLDVASDKKESCANIVFREDFEQVRSVRVVGAIVVGESDLARVL